LEEVEKIYINSAKTSQYAYTQVNTGITIRNQVFNGYLKFSSGKKIFLIQNKNKKTLLHALSPLAHSLEQEIQDYS
jgi:hypothetical protein